MGRRAFSSQAASLGGSENATKITKRVSRETIPNAYLTEALSPYCAENQTSKVANYLALAG
jgi:hypothetical protein